MFFLEGEHKLYSVQSMCFQDHGVTPGGCLWMFLVEHLKLEELDQDKLGWTEGAYPDFILLPLLRGTDLGVNPSWLCSHRQVTVPL